MSKQFGSTSDKNTNSEKSLEDKSSWFSWVFMFYLDKLFAQGNTRTLEMQDLGNISKQDRSDLLYEAFVLNRKIEMEKSVGKRSLWKTFYRTIGYSRFAKAYVLFCISAAIQFGPVLILTRLVKHYAGISELTTTQIWILVCLLFAFPIASSITQAHANIIMSHVGCQIRNILIDAIYRKALVISSFERQKISIGKILTMFSDDANQIRIFFYFFLNSVCAPLQIAGCLYLIYDQVGPATFVGLGYSVLAIPLSGFAFFKVSQLRTQKMTFTDQRVKLMNEILNGIRIIKYYAWETAFIEKISAIRLIEVQYLAKMGYVFSVAFSILMIGGPPIQTILIFYTYIQTGHTLDAARAFTILTLFGLMQTPFIFLPYGLQQFNQASVAMTRIMSYLDAPELDSYIEYVDVDGGSDSVSGMKEGNIIEFDHASISWQPAVDHEQQQQQQQQGEAEPKQSSGYAVVKAQADDEGKALGDEEQEVPGSKNADYVEVKSVESKALTDNVDKGVHTLTDVHVDIKEGELVGIVGAVGSGKSSFLCSILGEMCLKSGSLRVVKNRSIAYCDQRPFVLNATVTTNILFESNFDQTKFDKCLDVTCLRDDVKVFPHGLDTEIGERGITLSGGQKTRISLCRAVYSDSDVYLLDDPLSAVDAHVGEHIFNKCIKEYLRGKTRLLVTHHLWVLANCDKVIVLNNNGTVRSCGTFEEVSKLGFGHIESIVQDHEDDGKPAAAVSPEVRARNESEGSKTDGSKDRSNSVAKPQVEESKDSADDAKVKGDIMTTEEKKSGSVELETYFMYFGSGTFLFFFGSIFFQCSSQVVTIVGNFRLTDWGEETVEDYYERGHEMSKHESFYWLNGYAALMMGGVLCGLVSRIVLTAHRTVAAVVLHSNLLTRVLQFPITFYDTTPIGRVINRFSQDMATVDEDLSSSMAQALGMGGSILGSVGAICGSTKGTFIILMVPLSYLYKMIDSYFRKSNTAIARLESVSRSPIYADFSQTLNGATTIRGYRQQEHFINRLESFANSNTIPGIYQQLGVQWLGLRLDLIGAIVMFFMGAITVILQKSSFIPAGYLALGLSYSIALTSMLKLAVRVVATMEGQFNSVERFRHYIENEKGMDGVKREDQEKQCIENAGDVEGDIEMNTKTLPNIIPPEAWPQNGEVEFRRAFLRYRDLPLVLKGVSFTVKGRDKVGIAGRTGCGKSSLMVALFRIEELVGGQIYIDGIDISRIPVQLLRKKLCIIPQDPVMFSATVRFNLDPFNECTDSQLWEVLEDVQMKTHIESLPSQLLELVSEGGDNFSSGQRQLICIARAILRSPKILVMDEATASIDNETDAIIQLMIRTKFKDCTILTIAHRLHTVIDSDKILVLDAGNVVEYDSPKSLLGNLNGAFKSLWDRHVSEGDGAEAMKMVEQLNALKST